MTSVFRHSLHAALALIVCPLGAVAQSSDAERLAALHACLAIEADAARLECLETRLTAGEAVEPEAARPAGTRPAGAAPPPRRHAAEAAATAGASRAAARPVERAGREGERSAEQAEVAGQTVRIVEVRSLRRGDTRFVAADGRVFAQSSSARLRHPELPFDAVLEQGALGSLFLSTGPGGSRVRVMQQE